jgi:Flp pilus assembly protein TadG
MTTPTEPEKRSADRRPSLLRRFFRDRSGSTVIEFAMLALPFSLLTFAILESCISFAGQQVLANATDNVARELRTGQIKAADLTVPKLKKLICDQLEVMVAKDCPGLSVDLRSYATFADAAAMRIVYTGSTSDDRDLAASNYGFSPGLALSKNMLRVFYKWPVMTDIMRKRMSTLKGGNTLLFATATWENEPFTD